MSFAIHITVCTLFSFEKKIEQFDANLIIDKIRNNGNYIKQS